MSEQNFPKKLWLAATWPSSVARKKRYYAPETFWQKLWYAMSYDRVVIVAKETPIIRETSVTISAPRIVNMPAYTTTMTTSSGPTAIHTHTGMTR